MIQRIDKASRYVCKPKIVHIRHCRTPEKEQEPGSSRRIDLIAERDEQRWLNRRFTSKGNVVGWYLALEAHQAFWTRRKTRANRRTVKEIITKKERKIYRKVKASRIKEDIHLTGGQIAFCINLFEKTLTPEQQEEAAKKQLAAAELTKILESLKQGTAQHQDSDDEEIAAPQDDDAAFRAHGEVKRWEEYRKKAKKQNSKLLRVMRNELREDGIDETGLWQEAGKDQCFE